MEDEGYTLVELVVVMLVFSLVMTIMSVTFTRIVASSGQIVASGNSDIGDLIGLELFRCDLELAGFGLFWSVPDGFSYDEASEKVMVKGWPGSFPGADRSLFNDGRPLQPAKSVEPPRAYVIGDNVGLNGSDYLVLKGTALGMNNTSRSWSYLNYSSGSTVIKPSKSEVELTPDAHERVVVVENGVRGGLEQRQLVTLGSSFTLVFDTPLQSEFQPKDRGDKYLVYGVAPVEKDADGNNVSLSIPFNRADYYISRSSDSISGRCAHASADRGAGALYKYVHSQNGKEPLPYPILDCVADMQVVLYRDTNGDGEVDYHSAADEELTASGLRGELKEIRVYILAQQGKKDPGFSYQVHDPERAIFVGDLLLDPSLGKFWKESELSETFGADWRQYRWKIYTIVVQPKNL